MPTAVFRCPGCGVKLKAKPNQTGMRYRCPRCRTPVTVPAVGQAAATGDARAFRVVPTGPVVDVLRRCFQLGAADRWRMIGEAADAMAAAYR